jgi:hypothetical protein
MVIQEEHNLKKDIVSTVRVFCIKWPRNDSFLTKTKTDRIIHEPGQKSWGAGGGGRGGLFD